MKDKSGRVCPLCSLEKIPLYRAMCGHCFDRVPWNSRAEFLRAWRLRVMYPLSYQEQLIELKMWFIDKYTPSMGAEDIEPKE